MKGVFICVVKFIDPLMGTETLFPLVLFMFVTFIILVKFIDPLMGTETSRLMYCFSPSSVIPVKFIDPLMGTETIKPLA